MIASAGASIVPELMMSTLVPAVMAGRAAGDAAGIVQRERGACRYGVGIAEDRTGERIDDVGGGGGGDAAQRRGNRPRIVDRHAVRDDGIGRCADRAELVMLAFRPARTAAEPLVIEP